ncbi:hypothetical protein SALBM135S_10137 [Streptomyces alboniger]
MRKAAASRGSGAAAARDLPQGVVTLLRVLRVLRGWPREVSLEDHLVSELSRLRHVEPPVSLSDEVLAAKTIRLADTEPALRTLWLMACDQTGQELRAIIGERLDRPAGDLRVRLHAAAASSVVRVLDEQIRVAMLAGTDLLDFDYKDVKAPSRHYAHAIRTAADGAIAAPVA